MAEKTITYIPPKPQVREKRVGIYCRVSTNSTEQLNSLTAQISAMMLFAKLFDGSVFNLNDAEYLIFQGCLQNT